MENIAIITIDSLRFDVAVKARTPNFESLGEPWHCVGAHGTYTLPSHISMFHNGYFPNNNRPEIQGPYNDKKIRMFRSALETPAGMAIVHPTSSECPNIVRGFAEQGYRTVGVGGVDWFRLDRPQSSFWKGNYFDEFYHHLTFTSENRDAFQHQINYCKLLDLNAKKRPLFFFLNISSTHAPYRNGPYSVAGQIDAFEYVDSLILDLIDLLPRPLHLIICSDHGDCFGEDELWGHGIYHSKVMEVPMISIRLDK